MTTSVVEVREELFNNVTRLFAEAVVPLHFQFPPTKNLRARRLDEDEYDLRGKREGVGGS